VLDVGSGSHCTFPVDRRPSSCHYVGLDLSREELSKAAIGSYDEIWECDIAHRLPQLVDRFDLAVSWQVLEHVRPLEEALENVHSYLRSGGRFVATLSGKFSAFALINQMIPRRFGIVAMQRLLGREPDTVFPAYYDRCWETALVSALDKWSSVEVVPFFIGATYFSFSRALWRTYLSYEEWIVRRNYSNLATHYLIDAIR
jgi:SAM-dependent methyltransferase